MSSFYTLDHVIQECLREKTNVLNTARGKSLDSKVEIYGSSWDALNAWIESRLRIHKGASISGFASFCWEMLEKNGQTHCRPLFLVADSFVKTFRVRRPRIHQIPQLTPVEEVNFSMLAIKFSKNLTKDMIFNGVRDIVRKIGEFIYRGYEMQIAFTFGTLYAKETRVKFTFSQSRLIQILPENVQPGVFSTTDAPMKYIIESSNNETEEFDEPEYFDGRTTARKSSTAPSKRPSTSNTPRILTDRPMTLGGMDSFRPPAIPTLNFNRSGAPSMTSTLPSEPAPLHSPAPATPYGLANTNPNPSLSNSAFPGIAAKEESSSGSQSDLKAVLDAIANKHLKVSKDEWRNQARDKVIQLAFDRCLGDVEKDAQFDEQRRFEAKEQFDNWRVSMREKSMKQKESMDDLKKTLEQQVEQAHARTLNEKLAMKNSVSNSILPENAGMVVASSIGSIIGEDGKIINSRQRISKDLESQIRHNAEAKDRAKREAMMKERDFIEKLTVETEFDNLMARSTHLEKQKALLEAWERDCHVRNVKKLQGHGPNLVKDYIQRNLAEPSSGTMQNTLGKSLNMSIGYDPRTGKL